ncbi:MAG TPA: hypothetical protein VMQ62_14150, partial [Dongiaceae bacterium]|nr:hypothetical protein [Dongiaceae bacterium]
MTRRAREAVAVAAVAILAGLSSLDAGFVHDDHRLIEQNEWIRDLGHPARMFTQGYWTVDATSVPNLYRPVTTLSFALNRALFGAGPVGYRAVNLLLHASVAVLVLLLARRFTAAGGLVGRGA